jgi:hypothetical protein
VARIKPDAPHKSPVKSKAKSRPKPASHDEESRRLRDWLPQMHRRALAAIVLAVVALLTLVGSAIWRKVAPIIAQRSRYVLQDAGITISPLPEWIIADVRGQVVQSAGLAGRLSILDPEFATTIKTAFELHPWVERVDRVEKSFPPAAFVEVTFRRPVAVVDVPVDGQRQLLPVDGRGIHLPAADVPLIRRSYLPRITGIVGQPPTGRPWDDPRVAGAVDLAVQLASDWESLNLVEIIPSVRPKMQEDVRYYAYDLATRERTRIVWGAAPRDNVPGESPFAEKLARLKQCVAQYAAVDWPQWPEVIDIRQGAIVTPREAKRRSRPKADEPFVARKATDEDGQVAEPVVK